MLTGLWVVSSRGHGHSRCSGYRHDLGTEALTAAHHAARTALKIDYGQKGGGRSAIIRCGRTLRSGDPHGTSGACPRSPIRRPGLFPASEAGRQSHLATINRNIKSFLFAIIAAEYILRLLPVGSHRHARFIRPQELKEWGEESHLEIQDVTGLGYNPFTHGYFLTKDTSVNYLAHFKRIGLVDENEIETLWVDEAVSSRREPGYRYRICTSGRRSDRAYSGTPTMISSIEIHEMAEIEAGKSESSQLPTRRDARFTGVGADEHSPNESHSSIEE